MSPVKRKTPLLRRRRNVAARRQTDPISIRMYNVGFGDCFMVTVPQTERPLRILFDCGSIAQDPDVDMDDVLQQLWADATDPGEHQPRIDVVVGTHRHRDHVSGFARPGWDDVVVGEVWMPWTEHPTDVQAKRIRETQSRLAAFLHSSLQARLGTAANDIEREGIKRLEHLAANALSNAQAMSTLHEGFAGNPKRRFLPEDGAAIQLDCPILPGMTVYVLAPSRSKDVIRDMDPPVGQSYLRLAGALDNSEETPHPFARGWRIDLETWTDATQGPASMTPDTPVARILGQRTGHIPRPSPPHLSEADRKALLTVGEMNQAVAVSLDKAVNGTSLMILLKIAQAYLLFPGDAQWGSWQDVLRDEDLRRLLERVTFYKVGHHGSHNATPIEFVEKVIPADSAIPAMVSTRPIANWPEIPRLPLLEALTSRGCDWIRSDLIADSTSARFKASGKTYVDVEIPV